MKKGKHKTNASFLRELFHHLEGDIKGFKKEIKEDRDLIKSTKKKYSKSKIEKHLHDDIKYYKKEAKEDKNILKKIKKDPKKLSPAQRKFDRVLHEYKEGELHSGSKKGPRVKNRKQALAIAFSEKKRAQKHK